MRLLSKLIMYALASIVIIGGGVYAGYYTANIMQEEIEQIEYVNLQTNLANVSPAIQVEAKANDKEEAKEITNQYTKITLVKNINGEEIKITKVIEPFMVGMTKEEIATVHPSYTIKEFTDSEIVLYKEVNEFEPYYILGIDGDNIAVFYKTENDTQLIQITESKINGFSDYDVQKLRDGIIVKDENELIRILQDYES